MTAKNLTLLKKILTDAYSDVISLFPDGKTILERQVDEMFAPPVKEKALTLKQARATLKEIMAEEQDILNRKMADHRQHPNDFEFLLDCNAERKEKWNAIVRKLEFAQKRASSPKGLEWDKKLILAKQVPMTDFVKFNRSGFTLCPFHNDHNPSFKYYKKSNTGFCFSCHKSADTIDVVREQFNLSLKDAVNHLVGLK